MLSLVLTWPLARDLGGSVEDRQDALLNVWITAWDGHQLLSDPLHLFDANIFHPYDRTLAYSELLLGNGLLALPVTAVTGNPILGYNLALLLSFFLTAFGAYLLVLRLTRSPCAGLVAGTILSFCSFRMTNLAQAQLLTTQWLPLALLALHALLRRPRPRHVALFALFFSLQALSSFYYGMMLALAVLFLVALAFVGRAALRRAGRSPAAARPGRAFLALVVTALFCLLMVLPFALPYFQVQGELGFRRALADSEPFSASLRQYLSVPPGSLLARWLPSEEAALPGGYPADALYPGLVALLMALAGIAAGRGRARWLYLALLLASLALSFGPRLYLAPGRPAGLDLSLPYAWLYAVVPGFKALRAPVRFDALVMLALAVLAGHGIAALNRRTPWAAGSERATAVGRRAPARAALLSGVCLLLVVVESSVWPAARAEPVPVGREVPAAYRWLAEQPTTTMLELPMAFAPGGPQLEYQYFSTLHWHTTPDGYSGFIPPKHGQVVYEMERFPSERSVSLLQALGVEYVVVHTDRYPTAVWQEMQASLAQRADLAPVRVFGSDQVFRVQERPAPAESLSVTAYLPPQAAAGQPYAAYLVAINHASRSHAILPTHQSAVVATWEVPGASAVEELTVDVPLVISPDGGAAVIPLALIAPATAGTYRLSLVAQSGPLGPISTGGQVAVSDAAPAYPAPFPVPAQLAAAVVPPTVKPGQSLDVEITWRALGKIDAYYSVYVKLLDGAGNVVAGWDGQPQGGAAPTLLWVPGATVDDRVTLDVPPGTPPGEYSVEAGMYRAEDLARAMTLDAAGLPLYRVILGGVHVGP
jgi:hypothetical protein